MDIAVGGPINPGPEPVVVTLVNRGGPGENITVLVTESGLDLTVADSGGWSCSPETDAVRCTLAAIDGATPDALSRSTFVLNAVREAGAGQIALDAIVV